MLKLLRRLSDNAIEDVYGIEPWVNPASWTARLVSTHEAIAVPGDGMRAPLIDQGACVWSVVNGAWVARATATIQAEQVVAFDAFRFQRMMALQAECESKVAAAVALAISTGRDFTAAIAACTADYAAKVATVNALIGTVPSFDETPR
jgi:hypothetical protein